MTLRALSVDDPALVGCVLAHAERLADGSRIAKGTVIDAGVASRLKSSGSTQVIVAVPQDGDMLEDDAALAIAEALCGEALDLRPVGTGRVNIHARHAGVLLVDAATVNACNDVDGNLTIATLPPFKRVAVGDMVATVKVIAFAVSEEKVRQCAHWAGKAPLRLAAFGAGKSVRLIQTVLPSLKSSVLDKTERVTADRLDSLGLTLAGAERCAHEAGPLADRLRLASQTGIDATIVFGASAVCDDNDVIPEAIRLSGGEVVHVGMPVDPGNLLVYGRVGAMTVIGAPGCARSPKRNGFDWIIERWLAGLSIDPAMIRAMGVGGLLSEIDTRPRPRGQDGTDD